MNENCDENCDENYDEYEKVEKYILVKKLGNGSYSNVYLAYDRVEDKMLALKCMSTDIKQTHIIDTEISILKTMDHPNIVKLFGTLCESNCVYLIMEWMEGGPITYLKEGKSGYGIFSEDRCKHIMQNIVNGLQELHSKNIVHGDIKPENILMSADEQIIKLADFGFSKLFTSENDLISSAYGTPLFTSPEACSKKKDFSGKSTDIWALGITFYILMYGVIPYDNLYMISPSNLYELLSSNDFQINFPSNNFSVELNDLLKRMLKKDPLERITLQEICDDLWMTNKLYFSIPSNEDNQIISPYPSCVSSLPSLPSSPFSGNESFDKINSCKNILIVEDQWIIRKIMCNIIYSLLVDGCNIEIDMAGDGKSAIKFALNKPYRLMFVDLHLPTISGLELTKQIRKFENETGKRSTPIIGITADATKYVKINCLSIGMSTVYVKPFTKMLAKNILEKYKYPLK
jgi:serine/threonine protein kinase